MNPDSELAKLMARFPRQGRMEWIGIRPERRAPLATVDQAEAIAGYGLAGDHYASKNNGKRQVTLIQAEHLEAVAKILGKAEVRADSVRRNLLVSGINLFALRDRKFRIGGVFLEGRTGIHLMAGHANIHERGSSLRVRAHPPGADPDSARPER